MRKIPHLSAALALALVPICPRVSPAQEADPLADFLRIVELREDAAKKQELADACRKFANTHSGTKADAHVLYYGGKASFDLKQYDDTIEATSRILENHPGTPLLSRVQMLRGEAHRLKSDWENALPDFRDAYEGFREEKNTEAPHALYHLVQSYFYTEEKARAEEAHDLLVKDYPTSKYIATTAKLLGKQAPGPAAPKKATPFQVGDEAPEFTFIQLDDKSEGKLSDLEGKVVVVDFWASWCGPCQAPMAKMQTYAEKHPEWGEKVVLMALSIDNTSKAAADHLESKGWDKTYNVWAGAGGFRAPAPTTYQVRGIPSAYVIDQEGKIAAMGHPNSLDIPDIVGGLVN